MRKRDEAEYRAKVTVDTGLIRGRVPAPLLSRMGARPGDHMIFRLADSGQAVMRLSHSSRRTGKGKSKRR
jgi:hypothetical protein